MQEFDFDHGSFSPEIRVRLSESADDLLLVWNWVEPVKPPHDSVVDDRLVVDVHTDAPFVPDGDPGAVLHQAVGNANLLVIAVDNGPDRILYAGPVLSHYEFLTPYVTRLTDEEWKTTQPPEPPPWTGSYLIRR